MTSFETFDDYLALPRVGALTLSRDGRRLVATIASLSEDGDGWVSALWDVDPAGERPARRLTWSAKGESGATFTPDGDLLFRSARDGDEDDPPALWLLPAAGGDARRVLERGGGVDGVAVARDAGTVVVASPTLPGADSDADTERRKARKDAKVRAILHEQSPIRYWDHDLGPDERHLLSVGRLGDDGDGGDAGADPRDLTPTPGRALDEQSFVVSADGATVLTSWGLPGEPGFPRPQLVAIDVVTGEQRVLAAAPDAGFEEPALSRDGRQAVCVRTSDSSYDEPPVPVLWLVDLATGEGRELAAGSDLWPGEPQFTPDGTAVVFTADQRGHRPVFRADVATGEVTRLVADGHHASVCLSDDGASVYALRDEVARPPAPVRLDARAADGAPTRLLAPGGIDLDGRVEQVTTTVEDGTEVRAWLVLPESASEASPAPFLLWIHGGPLGSWNGWSWRWNPWLMVAKGYAVLLPDPALSTGYGRAMVDRGWGQWGGTPFTDLMAVTDVAVARPDVDETRTAAMGGSYGGYMANWVAGHTDRFRCIVTHASLWALDQFQGTTDVPAYWAREWGLPPDSTERYDAWSPHHSASAITTPMLVVHGDKDYRVPIGEGLRLWWDLQRLGVEAKFLYYPDEGHWVLQPGNSRVWYETCWAWLATHVLGEDWQRPSLV